MTIPTPPTKPHTLAASPKEAPVSKLLVGAVQEISKDKPADNRLILRFAGGQQQAPRYPRHGHRRRIQQYERVPFRNFLGVHQDKHGEMWLRTVQCEQYRHQSQDV